MRISGTMYLVTTITEKFQKFKQLKNNVKISGQTSRSALS